jgi:hypothetical protein
MTTSVKTSVRAAIITPEEMMLIPDTLFDKGGSMADFIHATVDGYFDCVRPVAPGLGVVGYVHDEGLLLGLQPNAVASALFGRFLVGTCVVVGAFDDNGNYDGDNHNISADDMNHILWLADAQRLWFENHMNHRHEEEEV